METAASSLLDSMSAATLLAPPAYAGCSDDIEKLTGRTAGRRVLNVLCIGAHPDDPESGCGGTLAKLAAEGHKVSIVYLTRGEAGIRGGEPKSTARVRSSESLRACGLLRSKPLFGNQIDGKTSAGLEQFQSFLETVVAADPDVVFTHWPIDTHPDHRTAAQLAYQAWQTLGERFTLIYYEVMAGVQTHHFQPNCFIDIGATWRQKQSAVYAHQSQNPGRFYPYHAAMEKQRGAEAACERAEAFVVVREKSPKPILPFSL